MNRPLPRGIRALGTQSTPEERFKSAALTKSDVWAYEDEWRVVIVPRPFGMAAGVQTFPPEALSRVVLGVAISDSDRDMVLRWVREYPATVEVLCARLLPNQYALELVPFSL